MTTANTTNTSSQVFEVQEKLAKLEAGLLETVPNIAVLLRDIHKQLKADPDIVTVLSEEECSILTRGLKKQTATVIATSAKKKSTKTLKSITVADL